MTIHLLELDSGPTRTMCRVEKQAYLYETSVADEYETPEGRRIEAVTGIRSKADCKSCLRIRDSYWRNRR